MSKWLIITVTMVVVTIGIIVAALVYLLKKNQAEEDAADDLFLRSKTALLNKSVEEQLKNGIVSTEGVKILVNSKTAQNTVAQSNAALTAALASKRKVIDDLKRKYNEEMSKIKNK